MAAVTIHSDFGAHKNSLSLLLLFPLIICHEMMRLDAMILVFCFFVLFFFFHFEEFFFNFYFYFILLYNTVLVLPYIDMNPPWVYMRSQTFKTLIRMHFFRFQPQNENLMNENVK